MGLFIYLFIICYLHNFTSRKKQEMIFWTKKIKPDLRTLRRYFLYNYFGRQISTITVWGHFNLSEYCNTFYNTFLRQILP